jgi:3',5'-cyclic AMP phosphodiesterase CpdA
MAIAPPTNPLPSEQASASVTRFSFLAYGDTRGRRDGPEIQYEHSLVVDGMVAAINRLSGTAHPVRFVVQTGDAVFDGREPGRWNTSFVGLINRLTTVGGVPYFLAPGNHDVWNNFSLDQSVVAADRQTAMPNYLTAISQLIPRDGAQRRLSGYPTYAFGYGNTFVVAMDSNIPSDQVQFDWIKAQLEGLDRRRYVNVVVVFHHPVFSSGPHGGAKVEAPTAALRARYMPLFREHHVRLVLTGHEHLFEHWVERYADAAGQHRMDLVVTGGGGAPLYSYQGEPDVAPYLKANADAKVRVEHLVKPGPWPGDNPFHFVIVRVDGGQLDLEVVGVDWGVAYRPYQSNRTEMRDAVPGGQVVK